MKRAAIASTLAAAAVVASLLAFHDGFFRHRSATTIEQVPGEAKQAQRSLPTTTAQNDPTVSPSSDGSDARPPTETSSDPPVAAERNPRATGVADNGSALEWSRKEAARDIQKGYSILFDHLGVTAREQQALAALLVEEQLAAMWIYSGDEAIQKGKAPNVEERSNQIAAIIGDAKLQEFLALERNRYSYHEAYNIASVLRRNDAPLTRAQRDKLLEILIEMRSQYLATPTELPGAERGSLEYLEQVLTGLDEYQRHVIELAPTVLKPAQVAYLDQRYQRESYRRAEALELQRKHHAAGTLPEGSASYPIWDD